MGKVFLLSLGCPKNLVDSEKLLNRLAAEDIHYTAEPEDADIVMVNTCGFIEAAKKESIEEILRASEYKSGRKKKKLVVYGCLAKRSGGELLREIPEIDALWGVGEEDKIAEYCRKTVFKISSSNTGYASDQLRRKDRLSDKPYAYLKIAEGCDRKCSYCVIPDIRGRFAGRDPEQIIREAEALIGSGIKELILVAQDITSYGKGLNGYGLSRLIRDIAAVRGDFVIRLLYLYPTSIDDELIDTIASEEKVCKYIDMPLQHSSERMLKLMGRGGSDSYYKKLITKLRKRIPGVALRTTFIVGFPQETEEEFRGLLSFVKEMKFDRLGAFTYSREKGTPASLLKGQIPKKVKKERYNRLMEVQSPISLEINRKLVGRTFRALVDDVEGGVATARIYSQAPEIDGVVIVESDDLEKGSFIKVKITEAYDYDLKGNVTG